MAKKRTRSWRDQIEIHPAANLFPLLSETDPEGLRAMADSIAKHPMQVPDLLPVIYAELLNPDRSSLSQSKWEFKLLDGRNRLDAMQLAGIEFALRPNPKSFPSAPGWLLDVTCEDVTISYPLKVEQGDPWEYVRKANVERRMLGRAEKRALIKRLLKHAPEKSDRTIGRLAKSDKNTVAKVRAEEEARGEIHHVKTRRDSKNRRSPARRKTKPRKDGASRATTKPEATAPAATAAVTTQTAASKPPLRWIDGSTGEPWDGRKETRTLIGHAADGKEFWVSRYSSNMEPFFEVRVTIKNELKTLQQAVAIAQVYNADPNAPLPKPASMPGKGDKKSAKAKSGTPISADPIGDARHQVAAVEAPAPRRELTAEESAVERRAQNAAAETTALTVAPSLVIDQDGRLSVPAHLEPPKQKVKRGSKSAAKNLEIPDFLLRKQATEEAS
jgi:hypothetical protein